MSKRIKVFIVVLLFIMLTSLTGCHGSRNLEAFTIPESFDTTRNYELTFWAKNDTNVAQTNIYKKAIEDFMTLYPNITINLRLYTDYGRIYNDVITNIATRTTPNICITYPDHIATYLSGVNIVVPLDELFSDPSYGLAGSELAFISPSQDEIIPKFLEECKIQDHYYALPYMRSTEACYINKTYVEALGYSIPDELTWDFIWEVSEAAMATDENGNYLLNQQQVMIPFIYKSTDNFMIQMLRQKNAGYSTDDGDILLFNDTTKELLYTIAKHAKSRAFSTFKISSYPANFLNAGQCLFAIDSTAGSTWMGSNAPLSDISEDKYVEFETVVKPVPQYDSSNPQMISQGPSICIFNKEDSQEVLASWLFSQYLLSNEVQIAYSETEGYVPVTSKAQNSAEYQNYLSRCGEDNNLHYDVKINASKLLLDNVCHTFVTPVFNGSASLRDAAGQLIENVTKSMRRDEIVDDAYMDSMFEQVRSLYHLEQDNMTSQSMTQAMGSKKAELGALPTASIVLLVSLVIIWIGIFIIFIRKQMKKRY